MFCKFSFKSPVSAARLISAVVQCSRCYFCTDCNLSIVAELMLDRDFSFETIPTRECVQLRTVQRPTGDSQRMRSNKADQEKGPRILIIWISHESSFHNFISERLVFLIIASVLSNELTQLVASDQE